MEQRAETCTLVGFMSSYLTMAKCVQLDNVSMTFCGVEPLKPAESAGLVHFEWEIQEIEPAHLSRSAPIPTDADSGDHPTKEKAPGRVTAKCLICIEFRWLPDLGSNQGPTD